MYKKAIHIGVFMAVFATWAFADGILLYKPPKTGAPAQRIGGGTRTLGAAVQQLQVLAPQHTALTAQVQPVLYWYLAETNEQAVEISLIQQNSEQSLLRKQLPAGLKVGLQKIRLADESVSLQAGEDYQWSVALVGPNGLSRNGLVKAALRYESPNTDLTSMEQKAAAGYWYDVLQSLIEQNSPLANDLLAQIGLHLPNLQ